MTSISASQAIRAEPCALPVPARPATNSRTHPVQRRLGECREDTLARFRPSACACGQTVWSVCTPLGWETPQTLQETGPLLASPQHSSTSTHWIVCGCRFRLQQRVICDIMRLRNLLAGRELKGGWPLPILVRHLPLGIIPAFYACKLAHLRARLPLATFPGFENSRPLPRIISELTMDVIINKNERDLPGRDR